MSQTEAGGPKHATGAICVVGLGKIGLPLAVQCARQTGGPVIGVDIDPRVVASVNAGTSHVAGEDGLAEALAVEVAAGRLAATTDTASAVRRAETVLIIVPVGLSEAREVDFSLIDAATLAVGAGLRRGTLVIYETTVPVGTVRRRLAGLLERESGLRVSEDFQLAFSPERVYSGRIFRDLASYPKVVGGVDAASTERAESFYRRALSAPVLCVSSAEAAEYVKLVETTYRDVNIALANEYALFAEAHGLDVREVIAAANTQPFSHVHQPSVGVGGHCIPVYPYFLFSQWAGFRLPPAARGINDSMAAHGVALLAAALGDLAGRRVLILGLTYRENVRETAFSSAQPIAHELRRRGATVLGHDALLDADQQRALGVEPVALEPRPDIDGLVLQACHDAYRALDWAGFGGLQALLDGRGSLSTEQAGALQAAGVRYIRIGLGHHAEVHGD